MCASTGRARISRCSLSGIGGMPRRGGTANTCTTCCLMRLRTGSQASSTLPLAMWLTMWRTRHGFSSSRPRVQVPGGWGPPKRPANRWVGHPSSRRSRRWGSSSKARRRFRVSMSCRHYVDRRLRTASRLAIVCGQSLFGCRPRWTGRVRAATRSKRRSGEVPGTCRLVLRLSCRQVANLLALWVVPSVARQTQMCSLSDPLSFFVI
ncbi:hypothetical protein B0T16DRAFT_489078 [Cercophora newfieldiana]|uniref:Uncharacterized protein n=1 Tax=Cercophora newfieldiana TaxID=92897 RepID=A0AA40D198_9PEZI|nr:hypothetical protein B0T16DRAFT_489078 [Cercophora newfieldiana]